MSSQLNSSTEVHNESESNKPSVDSSPTADIPTGDRLHRIYPAHIIRCSLVPVTILDPDHDYSKSRLARMIPTGEMEYEVDILWHPLHCDTLKYKQDCSLDWFFGNVGTDYFYDNEKRPEGLWWIWLETSETHRYWDGPEYDEGLEWQRYEGTILPDGYAP